MKLLPLIASGVLAFGGAASAAPRDVTDYLQRAGAQASADLTAAGLDVGPGLSVRATVGSDGRLTGARVVSSSGSLETDQKAARALRRLKVPAPPLALIGADVTVAVAQVPAIQTAKVP